MRYSGSKDRFAKDIIPFITRNLTDDKVYIEPFCGGCNLLSKIEHNKKWGNDKNEFVISMWQAIKDNKWLPQENITKRRYEYLKKVSKLPISTKDKLLLAAEIGYVGNACSYGSAWFNGYANYNKKRKEDHIKEAYNNLLKQIENFKNIQGTIFTSCDYDKMEYPSPNKCVIYCDPPYSQTKNYKDNFDNDKFWEWAKSMKAKGYEIYVSEYTAPNDVTCIWEREKKDGLKLCDFGEKQATKIERLFKM